jgi:protein ImuB
LSKPVETFVVVASVQSAQRITVLTDGAVRLGLKAGMGLADARAMYPKLPVVEADPEADQRLLEGIANWCDRYTPLIGLDPPDGLLLDVTGCAHLFGGEAALARDLVRRLAQQGLRARVAVADTAGCAWGVARYGEQGIVPAGETKAAMLDLPIAALRVGAEIVADLKTSGLTCIADLMSRPRAPFTARFGKELLLRLDQALGHIEEPISPRQPLPAAMAERRFADPIAREADVLGTIEKLASQLVTVLDRRGEGGRLFQVALFRADGAVHRLELGTGSPLRDPPRIRKLFEERLAVLGDACDPGFGYDTVRLSALATERTDPAQTGLGGDDHAEELAHLIDRLGARFGLRCVTRIVPQDTHIPEYTAAAVPAHGVREPSSVPPLTQDSLGALRPVRLFSKPQPISVVHQIPDGPLSRFRWMKEGDEWPDLWKLDWQKIAAFEGPERIAMEWWRNDRGEKLTRDYFRVESETGARFWLYREGLAQSGRLTPRWYVHGLFA